MVMVSVYSLATRPQIIYCLVRKSCRNSGLNSAPNRAKEYLITNTKQIIIFPITQQQHQ